MNGEKPTWTPVTHAGIIGHVRMQVSLPVAYFIDHYIKESGKLSINMADEGLLPQAMECTIVDICAV